MTPPLHVIILSGLVGAFLSSLVTLFGAHYLTVKRDREGRKRAFRSFVRHLIAELKPLELHKVYPGDLVANHKIHIPELSRECARIAEDIRPGQRTAFEKNWLDYCEAGPLNVHIEEIEPGKVVAYQLGHYEQGRKQLETFLGELLKCAT